MAREQIDWKRLGSQIEVEGQERAAQAAAIHEVLVRNGVDTFDANNMAPIIGAIAASYVADRDAEGRQLARMREIRRRYGRIRAFAYVLRTILGGERTV